MSPTSSSPRTHSALPESKTTFAFSGTFFPHLLIDEVMPTLSGSEWQLLTVIFRQTFGWYDSSTGGRKQQDWLSHSQLKARTGRGSDAVCRAVDTLVRKNLIEVRDERGRFLSTADERRRSCSRLYYSLASQLIERLGTLQHTITAVNVSATRTAKAETTKETETNYRTSSFGKSERQAAHHDRFTAKTAEVEKNGCGCLRPFVSLPCRMPACASSLKPEELSPQLLSFLRLYNEKLHRFRPEHQKQDEVPQEDRDRLQAALDNHSSGHIGRLAETFLSNESRLLHYRGYSISAFIEVLPTLSVLRANSSNGKPSTGC